MAKQTFTTGQVLTAAQMTSLQQTAMGGGSTTAKTVSYTLVAADAGTVVQMNSASATTITVNTALFAAGDTVQIQNIGAGVCTVTAGTATVNTSATLALSQYDAGQLYFNTTSAAFFFNTDAADNAGGITLLSTTTLTGASTAISSISQAYKNLYVSVEGAYAATSGSTIQIQGNTSNSFQMVGSYNVAGAGSPINYSQTWNSSLNLPLIAGSAISGYLTSAWAFTINNYASTTYPKPCNITGFWRGSATSDNVINAGGSYNTTAALSTLTFSMSAGNLGGGTVKVYGVN